MKPETHEPLPGAMLGIGYGLAIHLAAYFLWPPLPWLLMVWFLYGTHKVGMAREAGRFRCRRFPDFVIASYLWPVIIRQVGRS